MLGEVTLAISVPTPVLVIVMLAEAVLLGAAARLIDFRLTSICPGPGNGVDVGVADGVAVGVAVEVAVDVAVAVGVAAADDVEVAVAVGVAIPSGMPYASTRLF